MSNLTVAVVALLWWTLGMFIGHLVTVGRYETVQPQSACAVHHIIGMGSAGTSVVCYEHGRIIDVPLTDDTPAWIKDQGLVFFKVWSGEWKTEGSDK